MAQAKLPARYVQSRSRYQLPTHGWSSLALPLSAHQHTLWANAQQESNPNNFNISIKIQYSISTSQSNILMAQPYTQAQPVSYSLSIGAWVLKRVPCMPQSPTIWWLFNHEGPTLHTPHGEFHRSKPFIHNNIPLQIIIQLHAYHKHIIISLINKILGPSPTYTITRAKPSQTL